MMGGPTTPQPVISVLVVAYNSRAVIGACLQSLARQSLREPFEVLLIDNGSDGTSEWVASEFPQVRIVPGRGNIGFGAGNNALAGQARGEHLVLLNPDAYMLDHTLEKLLAFARSLPEATAWGGVITNPSGQPDVSNLMAIPSISRYLFAALGMERFHGKMPAAGLLAEPRKVEVLSGAFFMIRADNFRQLGGFDETFFLYSEEVDLFTRIKEAGGSVYATPDAVVRHAIGMTGVMTPERTLYKAKGMMHYARKHWPRAKAILAGLLIWIAAFERVLGGIALGWWKPHLAIMGKASRIICLQPREWWHGYND